MDVHRILILPKARIKLTFLSVVFIVFFHTVFQPFYMAHYVMNDFIFVNCSYLIISFIVISLHLIVFPRYFKEQYLKCISTKPSRHSFLVVIILSLAISFFTFKVLFGYYEFSLERVTTGLLAFCALAVFPILVLKFIDRKKINVIANDKLLISKKDGQIGVDEVICVYSNGNYVVWVCLIETETKEFKIRETFKSVIDRLQHQNKIIQTHRAFLVNHSKIDHVTKGNGSYNIILKNYDKNVPFSRAFYSKHSKNMRF